MNTMQQEFDAVVAHLYKQGKPAKQANGYCAYRGLNGTSCAVGCRIPDNVYVPEMDGTTTTVGGALGELLRNYADRLPREIVAYEGMFRELQSAHDSRTVVNARGEFILPILQDRLQSIADYFGLTFTVPQGA